MPFFRGRDKKPRTSGQGWFVDLATEVFRFLEDEYYFKITRLQDHFRGPFVWYANTTYQLSVQYDPEGAEARIEIFVRNELVTGSHARVMSVDALLKTRRPQTDWKVQGAVDGAVDDPVRRTRATLTLWADGLRQFAQDLLKGETLANAPWEYAW
jgi:hypothetical protein